jgi:hypothetical protein
MERVAISESAMPCQADFEKHRTACRTRDTPDQLTVFPFRGGVARGLPSGAFQFWFVFSPAAPSYRVHRARAALPVGFVSSHLYRVKALMRLFGSRSSSRYGL